MNGRVIQIERRGFQRRRAESALKRCTTADAFTRASLGAMLLIIAVATIGKHSGGGRVLEGPVMAGATDSPPDQ
jgi:hypothetical protein